MDYGKLGLGLNAVPSKAPSDASEVTLAGTPVEVWAGERSTCVKLTSGDFQCWGAVTSGEAGAHLHACTCPTAGPFELHGSLHASKGAHIGITTQVYDAP